MMNKNLSRFLLMLVAVVCAVDAVAAGGQERELWIRRDGRSIFGVLHQPEASGKKMPLVIISHGFNGTHHFGRNYFEPLAEMGFQVFSFDFPCGSVHSRSDSNTMEMSVLDEKDDLKAIVDYFRQQPDVDASRIVLIGESQGGLVTALAASEMADAVSEVVLVYPALCIPDNWNERYPDESLIPDTTRMWDVPLGRRYFREVRPLRVFDQIGRYKGPVLIVQGDKDPVVSMADSERAVALYANARLRVIAGAGHGFNPVELQQSITHIRQFLLHPDDGRPLSLLSITRGDFYGQSPRAVRPLDDGENYAQLSSDGRSIVRYSFKTGLQTGVLFDASTVKGDTLESIDGYTLSPDGQRLLLRTQTQRIYRHSHTATYYIYDIRQNRVERLSEEGREQAPLFSPDGRSVAFVRDNNLFIAREDRVTPVTTDGRRNEVINGIPDWVNEEEFGNDRSFVFTADGRHLVWVRYDESAVRQFSMPLYKGLKPERKEYAGYPGFYTYKYPIAGERNSTVTAWSYDIAGGQARQLPVPVAADGYIPRMVMTSDAPRVAVYTMNRHQDSLCVYMVNAATAECRQVIAEHADRYVREEAMSNIQITGRHILLPSDRDGNMHLYLYDLDGRLVRQVEQGDYEVSAVYGYDEKTGDTYFASHENGATDQRVWVVRRNGRKECLTPVAGWSTALFSTGFKYFLHTWSNITTPPVYTLRSTQGRQLTTLEDNASLRQQLSHYVLGQRELFTLTTADGITLNGWMVKPADFDPSRRYPVVMYQYGGPGNQQVRDAWGIGMAGQGAILEQYLCQQGFLCVCIDNRGTGGRGVEFEKCTYLRLGQTEAHDQVEAALWLGRQPYVDKRRIAIWGWSFGGFNTLMAMSEGREAFRAGIAIAPPTSWRYYDTVYTERYMRTPQENPEGYDDCPLSRADKLHGALLLVHGSADDNVHLRNTAEYTEALVQADKDFRQLVYTNRNHSIYGANTRHHLFRQCVDFFLQHMR